MTIYFVLIACVVLLMLLDQNRKTLEHWRNKSDALLLIAFQLLYLVCVLRAPTVGRDIPGYALAYEEAPLYAFDNFDYVYFENGYILMMKLCNMLGLTFQGFLAVVYFIVLAPVYLFIKHHSANRQLSVLIFICYISLDFALSGIRQAMAISILLLAMDILLQEKKHSIPLFLFLILLGVQIHESLYIGLLILPVYYLLKRTSDFILLTIAGVVVCLFFRGPLLTLIKDLFNKSNLNTSAGLHVGGNILFLSAISIFSFYAYGVHRKSVGLSDTEYSHIYRKELFMLKCYVLGLVMALFFGEETTARSYMYFSQTGMVLIPNLCRKMDKTGVRILEFMFVVFYIVFFYFISLKANNLDMVPYKFFWIE